MAISEELKIAVRVEAKNAISELQKLQGTTKGNTTAFAGMAKQLIGFGGVAAGLLAVKKLVIDNAVEGVKFAAAIEKQSVAFEVMLGSADAAVKLLEDIKDFSASTPFQLPQLTKATEQLLAFGTASKDIIGTMEMLGNAALGDAAKLDRLVLAYGKVQAKGKATLEELNMFTEAGVPLMAELAKQTGATKDELFDMITQGKIGFAEVNEALTAMTTGEGQFAGLIEKQAGTLSGVMSTFKDNIALLRADMVEGLLPALKRALEDMTGIVQKIREAKEEAGLSRDFSGNLALFGERGFDKLPLDTQSQILQDLLAGAAIKQANAELTYGNIAGARTGTGVAPQAAEALERAAVKLEEITNLITRRDANQTGMNSLNSALGGRSFFMPSDDRGAFEAAAVAIRKQLEEDAGVTFDNIQTDTRFAEFYALYRTFFSNDGTGLKTATQAHIDINKITTNGVLGLQNIFAGPSGMQASIGNGMQGGGSLSSTGRLGNSIGFSGSGPITPRFDLGAPNAMMGGADAFAFDNIAEPIDQAAEAMDRLGASMEAAFSSEVVDAAFNFGQALADGETGAMALTGAIDAFWKGMIQQLPQMLLSAAAQAAATGNYPLAAGLLAAAAGSAVVSGVVSGGSGASNVSRKPDRVNIRVYHDSDVFVSKVNDVIDSRRSSM